MATVQRSPEQRLLLYGVSWQEYSRALRAFAERPSLRVTYDRGVLEFITLSLEHESIVRFFSLLILASTLELGLPLKGGGSTTFRRRRRRRGLEPDECYWIANEPHVRGKDQIDLRRDPPPDLALEVDSSYSTLDRLGIYAALEVPEVWRYDGHTLTFYVLGPDGHYVAVTQSQAIPQVASAELTGMLALRGTMDENALFRHLQAWARQRFGTGGPTTP
ncbi:MAG TPA: Uma2 family endonuclease [Gemmataceae bacterium]|nr:Uma2 family endonuclease [Gemmataceae bacterium]